MPIDFFALPRTTRPADWFERILPSLPLQLPTATVSHRTVVRVLGAGGGAWSLGLAGGKLSVVAGDLGPIAVQYAMTAMHFRESHFGAFRERTTEVLTKLRLPLALPDMRLLQVDPARLAAVAALRGSIAFEVQDRRVHDCYRFVLTLGAAPAQVDRVDTTIEVDLDDLAALAAARTPPLKVITSGKLRIKGDPDLPVRALTALIGRAP